MRRWCIVALLGLGLGCQPKARPWDRPDAQPSGVTETPPPPIAAQAPDAGHAAPTTTGTADVPEAPVLPVKVGGPWVRCYGGFHPSGDPLKDLTRLSLLCGPENGMRRLSPKALEGAVAAGGPPTTDAFDARRGDCYRIFAVADAGVGDLDVLVRTSRGTPIAADHGEDAWPLVQPDRPFCALDDDRYTLEVSAKRGSGRFALEVWVLAPRTPKP